jgi:hypothetical protein
VQLEFPEVLGAVASVMYIEMDGIQLPMVHAELEGRAGRNPGQPARTREVKLGCVFTQTKIVLGDDAEWIWNVADQHFAGAVQIVDIWHARERLWDTAAKLFPPTRSSARVGPRS